MKTKYVGEEEKEPGFRILRAFLALSFKYVTSRD